MPEMLESIIHNIPVVVALALVAIAGIISWAVVSVTHARSGYNPYIAYSGGIASALGLADDDEVSGRQFKVLEAQLKARDGELQQLKDRVAVLERIITDRARQLDEDLAAMQLKTSAAGDGAPDTQAVGGLGTGVGR